MEWQVVACTKKEAPHLLEWCCYHLLKGAKKITIYDSLDDNARTVLSKMISAGIVDYKPWTIYPAQWQAYSDFIKTHQNTNEPMVAFIDADEFIVTSAGTTVSHLLDALPSHASGLAAGWKIFGDNGHELRPSGLVINNYTRRVNYETRITETFTKCIMKPYLTSSMVHDPHFFESLRGTRILNEDHVALSWGDHHWRKPEHFPMNKIWINHYFTKSKEDFDLKHARGGPDGGRRVPADFDNCNAIANEVTDTYLSEMFSLMLKETMKCYST